MEIILVYNAKSGILNNLFDAAHKTISPSTYACNLCKLTHSNWGERKVWKDFVAKSSLQLHFYHIDDFEKQFTPSYEYPIVLKKKNNQFEIVLNKSQISDLKNAESLIQIINMI